MSNFEESVIKILKKEKIPFIREKTFQDLKKGLYRFDFYIPLINILIEVDGAQHYEFNKKFYKNRQDFLKAKERDRIKNSYALSHNIKLYRIPYWEVENIKCFSDIIQNKYLVETKWHNDLLKK